MDLVHPSCRRAFSNNRVFHRHYSSRITQRTSLIFRIRAGAALAACLLLSLVIVACGGGSDSSTTTLSKAQIIKRGEVICEKAKKAQTAGLVQYQKQKNKPSSRNGLLKEVVEVVALPPIKTAVEELAALPEPTSGAKQFGTIVSGLEEALEKAESDPLNVATKARGNFFGKVDRRAAKFGFKRCSILA